MSNDEIRAEYEILEQKIRRAIERGDTDVVAGYLERQADLAFEYTLNLEDEAINGGERYDEVY